MYTNYLLVVVQITNRTDTNDYAHALLVSQFGRVYSTSPNSPFEEAHAGTKHNYPPIGTVGGHGKFRRKIPKIFGSRHYCIGTASATISRAPDQFHPSTQLLGLKTAPYQQLRNN